MKVTIYDRFSEARGTVSSAEPVDDMASTSSNGTVPRVPFSPNAITVSYLIDPAGWSLYSILVTGKRVLKKAERELGTKREMALYTRGGRHDLDGAPQWARDFATANHPDRRPAVAVNR